MARRIATLAQHRETPVRPIAGDSVRTAFPDNNQNKYQIATVIAARYPELSPRLGRRRRMWEAERYSMSIFDAAAPAVAYFAHNSLTGDIEDRVFSPLPH